MPAKSPLDENIRFLYLCLKHSDLKQIDFHKVGREVGINPPAARMRLTRLRRSLDLGLFSNSELRSKPSSPAKTIKRKGPELKRKAKQAEGALPEQEKRDVVNEAMRFANTTENKGTDPNDPISTGYCGEGSIVGLYQLEQTYGVHGTHCLAATESTPSVPIDPLLASLSLHSHLRSPYTPIYPQLDLTQASYTASTSSSTSLHSSPIRPNMSTQMNDLNNRNREMVAIEN